MIPPKEHSSYKIAKIVCGKRPVTKIFEKREVEAARIQVRAASRSKVYSPAESSRWIPGKRDLAARVQARAASRSKVYFPTENSHWIPGKIDLAARVQARAASRSKVYSPAESSRWIPGKQSVAVVLGGTLTK